MFVISWPAMMGKYGTWAWIPVHTLHYLQAIRTWKDSTEKDEKDSQRAINAEKQSRTAGLRELPMLGMFWPMSIALKSTSILR